MPELPEVETIKNELWGKLLGRHFTGISVHYDRMVQQPQAEELPQQLIGHTIVGLERRGKFIIVDLSGGEALIFHLGMTGALFLDSPPPHPDPYARIAFQLDNGCQLLFSDQRKFGKLWLVRNKGSVIDKLGPEPLDANFTAEALRHRLSKRAVPIKALLLEQDFIAGIGNIYASEALFEAGIHPEREGRSLSPQEIQWLRNAIWKVLRQAIESGGTTIRNYQDPSGKSGEHQNSLKVFGREGKPCPKCGTPIQRLVLRQRSTYFCPRCQS